MGISRRSFVKLAGAAAIGAAVSRVTELEKSIAISKNIIDNGIDETGVSKVYFTNHIDAEHLINLYKQSNQNIVGKVAIKLHTGEQHGPNILPPSMVKVFQSQVPNSAIVETNTLYAGDRDTTAKHRQTLKVNGWDFCPVDIMDEDGTVMLPVKNALHLKEVSMGAHITNYDSMIVLTHFKGHAMGGMGGSLKNIAIGCADGNIGKRMVHGYKKSTVPRADDWDKNMVHKEEFMENMADSGKAVMDYFGKHIVYLNVMRRMSVDCDCAGIVAAPPKINDIGILASTDILAIDQACVDLVYKSPEGQKHDLVERIESRHGLAQLAAMKKQKMGNDKYELINMD